MKPVLPPSLRWRLYAAFARALSVRLRRVPETPKSEWLRVLGPGARILWLHGASVGELEALLPIAEEWLRADGAHRVVVSAFSPSAGSLLDRLQKQWAGDWPLERFVLGFSPPEGGWLPLLERIRPLALVGYRYEAWPDLWAGLIHLGIPLWLLAARDRGALRWILPGVRWGLGVRALPQVVWGQLPQESRPIRSAWGAVQIIRDPRWDRVEQRRRMGSPRVKLLREWAEQSGLNRPWAVFGNVWPTDLPILQVAIRRRVPTLWVVPHRLDAETLLAFESFFASQGVRAIRSSSVNEAKTPAREPKGADSSVILVDEFGCLAELYGAADWTYVGGGFGSSIHNLLEPAVHGVAVTCGPAGATRFPEVDSLRTRGQLTVVSGPSQWLLWLKAREQETSQDARFREVIEKEDLGGAAEVVRSLLARSNSPH